MKATKTMGAAAVGYYFRSKGETRVHVDVRRIVEGSLAAVNRKTPPEAKEVEVCEQELHEQQEQQGEACFWGAECSRAYTGNQDWQQQLKEHMNLQP